jgi:hypothetical protein
MTGRIIEERRRRLKAETVEWLTCIKDWELAEARLHRFTDGSSWVVIIRLLEHSRASQKSNLTVVDLVSSGYLPFLLHLLLIVLTVSVNDRWRYKVIHGLESSIIYTHKNQTKSCSQIYYNLFTA